MPAVRRAATAAGRRGAGAGGHATRAKSGARHAPADAKPVIPGKASGTTKQTADSSTTPAAAMAMENGAVPLTAPKGMVLTNTVGPGVDELTDRALEHLQRVDDRFKELEARYGRPSFRRACVFEMLIRAITEQQLSSSSARAIWTRVYTAITENGQRPMAPATVADMDVQVLRSAGLSMRKAEYIKGAAAAFANDPLLLAYVQCDGVARPPPPDDLDRDHEVADRLLQIRGVGPWTVSVLQLFAMRNPDVLPIGDLGIVKGIQRFFGLSQPPKPAQMEQLCAPFAPYRSYAAWYLWRQLYAAPGEVKAKA